MKRPADNPDQLRQMLLADGLMELPAAPAPAIDFPRHSSLPDTRSSAAEARHLWVVTSTGCPAVLECCEWALSLKDKIIKHSNLTGGSAAHSGGELWFVGADRIAINAASGRYGAENEPEFNEIVQAIRASGYYVASMGFDVDNPEIPNRTFVGIPEWERPL